MASPAHLLPGHGGGFETHTCVVLCSDQQPQCGNDIFFHGIRHLYLTMSRPRNLVFGRYLRSCAGNLQDAKDKQAADAVEPITLEELRTFVLHQGIYKTIEATSDIELVGGSCPRRDHRAGSYGARLPSGLRLRDLTVLGVVASIGFTVSLFFATAAFAPGPELNQTKMGALLSFVAAPIALVLSRVARKKSLPLSGTTERFGCPIEGKL